MNITDFRFIHRLRVRWSEVDLQKIVFNAHYSMYLDTAIADYWRHLAIHYEKTMEQLGGDIFLKKSSIEFHASARYDDVLQIGLQCARIGNSSMQFLGGIFLNQQLLAQSDAVYVFANPDTHTPIAVPPALRQALLRFEDGEAVVTEHVGSWQQLSRSASLIRQEVFVEEQSVPIEIEIDELDVLCTHVVLVNALGTPVATGRLLPSSQGTARIGRMAVIRRLRETGLGTQVLLKLMKVAELRGDNQVTLHAQLTAKGFYDRLGFSVQGEPFEEAGIRHITMHKVFQSPPH